MSVRFARCGSSSATLRLFGQITPTASCRCANSPASARKRSADTMTGPCSGTGSPSATRRKRSSTTFPDLTSGIDALLERFDADALDRIDEQFIGLLAQLQIGLGDILDDVRNVVVGNRRTYQGPKLRLLVSASPDRDLIEFLAVLLDAKNSDVADVVVATRVDAARNIDVQPPQPARNVEVVEALGDFLRDRDRARVGEAAVIKARAGDDVGDESDIRRGNANRVERAEHLRQVALPNVRQHQVLLVADADFAETIPVG